MSRSLTVSDPFHILEQGSRVNLFPITKIGIMRVVFTHHVRKSKGTRENKQKLGIHNKWNRAW